MRIILSNHARLRSISRGITYEEICNTILAPEQIPIEPALDGVTIETSNSFYLESIKRLKAEKGKDYLRLQHYKRREYFLLFFK